VDLIAIFPSNTYDQRVCAVSKLCRIFSTIWSITKLAGAGSVGIP
jgi:hypothetical protein